MYLTFYMDVVTSVSIWRLPLNLHKCCIQCMSYSRPAITANMAKLHSCVARQALTVSQSLHAAILYRKERDTSCT